LKKGYTSPARVSSEKPRAKVFLQNQSEGTPEAGLRRVVGGYNAGAGVGTSAPSNDARDERANALPHPGEALPRQMLAALSS